MTDRFKPTPQDAIEPLRLQPTVSPLERAFETELRSRFGADLSEPYINQHGHLVRVSNIVSPSEDTAVTFQYIRFDILKSDPELLVKALRESEPSFKPDLANPEEEDFEDLGSSIHPIDVVELIMREEKQALDFIKGRIIARDGAIDVARALNDPGYYLNRTRLTRWPELFEVSIFGPGNTFDQPVPPSEIGLNGKIAGRRPDVYGRLRVSPGFEGIRYIADNREHVNELVIKHPRVFGNTIKAAAIAFGHVDAKDIKTVKKNPKANLTGAPEWDLEDMSWFEPSYNHPSYPIHPDSTPPGKVMEQIGTFVQELCKSSLP